MRKILILASIIGIAFYSCKKDPKINITNQVIGTWSLYSLTNTLNPQTPVATSDQYPCVADSKLIFKSDGTLVLPSFSKCYISAIILGGGSFISRNSGVTGTWYVSGISVYTTVHDSTTNLVFKDHYTLSNTSGKTQLKSVDTVLNGSLSFLYIKQ